MTDPSVEHILWSIPSPYTPEKIALLCDDLRVDRVRSKIVEKGLSEATFAWRRRKETAPELASVPQMQKHLSVFSKKIAAAKLAINDLDDTAWHLMRDIDDMVNSDPNKSRIDHVVDDPRDLYSPEVRGLQLFDGKQHNPVKMSDVIVVLDTLAEAAHTAAFFEKVKRGPQPYFPLREWIKNIHYMCERDLKIPFTRDVSADGTPISPAACFCVNAYSVLSDKTPPSRVLHQMKLHIQQQNELRRKN